MIYLDKLNKQFQMGWHVLPRQQAARKVIKNYICSETNANLRNEKKNMKTPEPEANDQINKNILQEQHASINAVNITLFSSKSR